MEEARIKHLEFIQAVIARQASHSFATKGWSVTVCTAAYFYALSDKSIWIACFAIVPALLFGYLDAYYLRNERAFRCLYKDVVEGADRVKSFDLAPHQYLKNKDEFELRWWADIFTSPPWFALHAVTIGVGVAVIGLTAVRVTLL